MISEYTIHMSSNNCPALLSTISSRFESSGYNVIIRNSPIVPRETLYAIKDQHDQKQAIDISEMVFDFSLAFYEGELYLCSPMLILEDTEIIDLIINALEELQVEYSIEELT